MYGNVFLFFSSTLIAYASCVPIVNTLNDTTVKVITNSEAIALNTNPDLEEDIVLNSILEIALDLSAAQWQKNPTGNVVISPVSIGALLHMVLLGVRGETHSELKKSLHYSSNLPDAIIHETYQKILGSIFHQTPAVNATTSSRIFMQEGLSVLGVYAQVAQALYNSKIRYLDFANNNPGAMESVYNWVSENTYGRIKNTFLTQFSTDTKFVAVNTVYFNGGWEQPFNERLTYQGKFNTGFQNITIPMMTNRVTVPYLKGNTGDFDMVALPYKGKRHSLYILTPNTMTIGIRLLQYLEYSLDASIMNNLIKKMQPTKISVTIPRMKLSDIIYLKEDLKGIGIKNIFDNNTADFGRLSPDSGIYLNEIINEAVLEVTEKGTYPSFSPAVAAPGRINRQNAFILDRPSLLFIRDNNKGLTLFWARVVQPEPIV